MIIRQENADDREMVSGVIKNAFEHEALSDHQEHLLVGRLRESDAFIPELSLVAERDNQIIGYILLTKIIIKNQHQEYEALALAPVAVLKSHQNQGIGSALIRYAHQKAEEMRFGAVVLLGHADYYPKFGYRPASTFGITLPFDVPDENCMCIELQQDALKNVSGMVVYPKAFYD